MLCKLKFSSQLLFNIIHIQYIMCSISYALNILFHLFPLDCTLGLCLDYPLDYIFNQITNYTFRKRQIIPLRR